MSNQPRDATIAPQTETAVATSIPFPAVAAAATASPLSVSVQNPQGPPKATSSTSPTTPKSGAKRPAQPRAAKTDEQLSEKKKRRLEKNRLSARECRRRKKEATENLERQINLLNAENLRLRLQLQVRTSSALCDFVDNHKFYLCGTKLNPNRSYVNFFRSTLRLARKQNTPTNRNSISSRKASMPC